MKKLFGVIGIIILVYCAWYVLTQYHAVAPVTQNEQPVATSTEPNGLPQVFKADAQAFSIRYPEGYMVDEKYVYQEMGPGKDIHGVSFTVSTSTTQGTNLSDDTYMSVESIPRAAHCDASLFLDHSTGIATSTVIDGDMTYSVASSTGAGAGNRYEETVYAVPGTTPCIAVRYFVHYGVVENYPEGTVRAFDRAALLAAFDTIRKSLVIGG